MGGDSVRYGGLPDVRRRGKATPKQKRHLSRRPLQAPLDADTGIAFPKADAPRDEQAEGPYSRWPNPYDVNPYLKLYDNEATSVRVRAPGRTMVQRSGTRPATRAGTLPSAGLEGASPPPSPLPSALARPSPPRQRSARTGRPQTAASGGSPLRADARGMLSASWRGGRDSPAGLRIGRRTAPSQTDSVYQRSPLASPGRSPSPQGRDEADFGDIDPAALAAALAAKKDGNHAREFLGVLGGRGLNQETGFEELAQSLGRLLSGTDVTRGNLSQKWKDISQWIDKFHIDRDSERLGRHCETLLEQVYRVDMQKGRKHPNPATTRTALVILDQLLQALERAQPPLRDVCRAVRTEVVDAVLLTSGDHHVPDLAAVQEAAEIPRLIAAAEEQFSGKMYYAVVRDIAHRIGKAEEEILREEHIRQKQMAVMDRGITFWQLECQKLILKAWRLHRRTEHLLAQKEQEQKNGRFQTELLRQEFKAFRQVSDEEKNELEHRIEFLTMRLAEKDGELQELRDQIQQLTEDRNRAYNERDKMQHDVYRKDDELKNGAVELRAMDELVDDIVRDHLEGPDWEVQLQEENKHFIEAPEGFSRAATLIAWYNAILATSGLGGKDARLRSFADAKAACNAHLIVMNYVSPAGVSSAVVESGMTLEDEHEKAAVVIRAAGMVPVEYSGSEELLLRPPHAALHHLHLAATIFERVADAGLCAVRGMPALERVDDGVRQEHPLSPRQRVGGPVRDLRTADEWRKRATKASHRLGRWRLASAAAQRMVVEVALGKLHGHQELKGMSESELQERDDVCLVPFRDTSRVFLPVKKFFVEDDYEREEQREELASLLRMHYTSLLNLFSHYAQGKPKMSLDGAWRLLSDSRISSRPLSKERVADVIGEEMEASPKARSFRGLGGDSSPTSAARSFRHGLASPPASSGGISIAEFAPMLLKFAEERNRLQKDGKTPVHRFNLFIQRNVIAHARWINLDEFRERCFQADVQEVLHVHNSFAARVFCHFIERDQQRRKFKHAGERMRLEVFCDLVGETGAVDSSLTREAVRETVVLMQGGGSDDVFLTYAQFVECLCALAIWKAPAPYIPMCAKVSRFFETWFVPQLSIKFAGTLDSKSRPDITRSLMIGQRESWF